MKKITDGMLKQMQKEARKRHNYKQLNSDLWKPIKSISRVFVPDEPKHFVRPKAEYSNHSPYGIADELHQSK